MKAKLFVIGFFLLALAACNHSGDTPVETRHGTSLPIPAVSTELSAIDSLMWQQPDSAFALLQQFAASPEAGDLDTYNGHYCQLLISELLYKKDYAQSNRPALRRAVAYFDSLTLTLNETPTLKSLIAGADPLSLTRNDCITFLAARAHYINGVGYYENESLVEACAEYLKALEVMEGRFEEKELKDNKARFMFYNSNRLGDLFCSQFMTESAILCYKEALSYYLKGPASPTGISRIYNILGVQYNIIGKKDSAMICYEKAIEYLPDSNSLVFRNILSSKALLSYQLNRDVQSALEDIKGVVKQTNDENEKLARYFTIGDIYFEDGQYDSARYYLELVFEENEDLTSKTQAAEYLRTIYDGLGEKEKSEVYIHYLANHKKSEAESKAFVSNLKELFQNYIDKKKEIQVEKERKRAVRNVIKIVVPLAVMLALFIIVIAKWRGRRLLKKQQKEAEIVLEEKQRQHEKVIRQKEVAAEKALEDKEKRHQEEMESERQAHKLQQAALSGRLKRSNEELRDLKEQIKRQDELDAIPKQAESFTDEPICRLILERVHDGQFKSKIDCGLYKSYALNKQQMLDLRMAVDRHYNQFTLRLRKAYPKLTSIDIDYCCLYLLNLTYADVSALMQRSYNTVVERDSKIQKVFGGEKPLPVILMDIAQNPSSI